MENDIDPNKRIIDLTVGQMMELLETVQGATGQSSEKNAERRLVYGISGIAQIFNCSIATANRIKKSGKINKAISQRGRLIVIDVDMALELFNNK